MFQQGYLVCLFEQGFTITWALLAVCAGAIIAVCPATGDGDDGESDTLEGISEEGGSSSEASGGKDNAAAKCGQSASQYRSLQRARILYCRSTSCIRACAVAKPGIAKCLSLLPEHRGMLLPDADVQALCPQSASRGTAWKRGDGRRHRGAPHAGQGQDPAPIDLASVRRPALCLLPD